MLCCQSAPVKLERVEHLRVRQLASANRRFISRLELRKENVAITYCIAIDFLIARSRCVRFIVTLPPLLLASNLVFFYCVKTS